MSRTGIFINYRREDSEGYAQSLFDRLNDEFPDQLFMDVAALQFGIDYTEAIERTISSCAVFIAIIGPKWRTVNDARGRLRLDDPSDLLRREIAIALRQDLSVIPVLVGGAVMPDAKELPSDLQPLAGRHALQIIHQDWDYGVERLIKAVAAIAPHPPLDLVGSWRGSDGLRYEISQRAGVINFSGFHPTDGKASAGEGRVSGRHIEISHYQTIYGAEGVGTLGATKDGRLIGSVTDRRSGSSLQIILSR